MSKIITVQDGNLEFRVVDGASNIDIGADGSFAGTINLGANIDINETNAQLLLPQLDTAATPALAFGDGNSGIYESANDILRIAINGSAAWRFTSTTMGSTNSGRGQIVQATPSATVPAIVPDGGDTDTGLGKNADDQLSLVSGGVEMLRLVETGVATTDQVIIGPAGVIGATLTPSLAFGDGDTGIYEPSDDQLSITTDGVTRFSINSARLSGTNGATLSTALATATIPVLIPSSADLDTGVGRNTDDNLSLIAGGVEMLRLSETGTAGTDQVIISPGATLRGAAATPLLAFGDGDSGFYETLDDILSLSLAGTQTWNFASGSFEGNATDAAALLNSGATATVPTVVPVKTDTNTGIGSAAADQLSLITGGIEANRYVARTVQTPNATPLEIAAISVPSGESFGFRINIVGRRDSNDDTMFESIFGAIRNSGGTTALVGSNIVDRTDDAGASTWVVTVAADDTSDELTVDVTGGAYTIDWKVSVEILNV